MRQFNLARHHSSLAAERKTALNWFRSCAAGYETGQCWWYFWWMKLINVQVSRHWNILTTKYKCRLHIFQECSLLFKSNTTFRRYISRAVYGILFSSPSLKTSTSIQVYQYKYVGQWYICTKKCIACAFCCLIIFSERSKCIYLMLYIR